MKKEKKKEKKKISKLVKKIKQLKPKQVVTYHDIKVTLDTHHLENLLDVHKKMLDVEGKAIDQLKINTNTIIHVEANGCTVMDSYLVGGNKEN